MDQCLFHICTLVFCGFSVWGKQKSFLCLPRKSFVMKQKPHCTKALILSFYISTVGKKFPGKRYTFCKADSSIRNSVTMDWGVADLQSNANDLWVSLTLLQTFIAILRTRFYSFVAIRKVIWNVQTEHWFSNQPKAQYSVRQHLTIKCAPSSSLQVPLSSSTVSHRPYDRLPRLFQLSLVVPPGHLKRVLICDICSVTMKTSQYCYHVGTCNLECPKSMFPGHSHSYQASG